MPQYLGLESPPLPQIGLDFQVVDLNGPTQGKNRSTEETFNGNEKEGKEEKALTIGESESRD